jgi:hypothetical protein
MLTVLGGIDQSRASLYHQAKEMFDDIATIFDQELRKTTTCNNDFLNCLRQESNTLQASLFTERVETLIKTDGRLITNVSEIGERVEDFMRISRQEMLNLNKCWGEWEILQDEYLRLGM